MDPRRSSLLAVVVATAAGACGGSVPLPKKAIELNASGARALEAGDLTAAEARLSVAIEYSPRFVEAWVNLGYVELRRGNFEQARRDFVKARDLNPDLPAPHHALGVVADKQGFGEEAEKRYRAALAVDPGFAPARINLARRLYARGQYENAREQFERLEQIAPGDPEGWAGRAEALIELGRQTEAEAVVEEGRAHAGDAPVLMILVGRQHLLRAEWEDAESVLAPVVGAADRTVACAALAWIAVGRIARGDPAGAAEAARAALAIDHDDGVAAYVLRRVRDAGAGMLIEEGAGTPRRAGRDR
jgi:Tfp pilus assembly protein PilF